MTYLLFHVLFVIPPIVVLACVQRRPLAGVGGRRAWFALPLTAMIAFVYTTPWDNYLVYRGVWSYGAERVLGTVGYVPVEEYLFFLLQPLLTGLWLYRLLADDRPVPLPRERLYRAGLFFYFAITALGVGCLASGAPSALYLGLILSWAGPVLLALWLYAGRHFTRHARTFTLAVAVPTVYLWIADAAAIHLGIWQIADRYSLGIDPFGLPIEEAVFFLVTNLLVVQGGILFLHGDRIPAPSLPAKTGHR